MDRLTFRSFGREADEVGGGITPSCLQITPILWPAPPSPFAKPRTLTSWEPCYLPLPGLPQP